MGRGRDERRKGEAKTRGGAVVRRLAPEEVRVGEFVTVLTETVELPPFLFCGDAALLPPSEPVRYRHIPRGAGSPLLVKSICLPFVLVQRPGGRAGTLDVRRHALARLDRSFAQASRRDLIKDRGEGKKRRRVKSRS